MKSVKKSIKKLLKFLNTHYYFTLLCSMWGGIVIGFFVGCFMAFYLDYCLTYKGSPFFHKSTQMIDIYDGGLAIWGNTKLSDCTAIIIHINGKKEKTGCPIIIVSTAKQLKSKTEEGGFDINFVDIAFPEGGYFGSVRYSYKLKIEEK